MPRAIRTRARNRNMHATACERRSPLRESSIQVRQRGRAHRRRLLWPAISLSPMRIANARLSLLAANRPRH